MSSTIELIKSDLIEQLDHLVAQRVTPAERAQALAAFTRVLYADVPPSQLVAQHPEQLLAAALSLFDFVAEREAGAAKVRVFTPDSQVHGWNCPHTVVELVTDDMPFLVDSVSAELSRFKADIQLLVHPILTVHRTAAGVFVSSRSGESNGENESVMHLQVRAQPKGSHDELANAILAVLGDVRLAVDDFPQMRTACARAIELVESQEHHGDQAGRVEAANFLRWLHDDDFAFFGYRHSRVMGSAPPSDRRGAGGGLGILRDPSRTVFEGLERPSRSRGLRIFKANRRSTIHRSVHLDVILVADISKAGEVISEHMFVGLFTLSAYSRSPENIPLLRHKTRRVLERAGFPPGSHNHKTLKYILETYPRDELFQVSETALLEIASGILHLQHRPRVALFARRDPLGRFVSCFVYVPSDRLDTALRVRMQKLIAAAYDGAVAAFYTSLGDAPLARIHIIIKTPRGPNATIDHAALERQLTNAALSWSDRLETALIGEEGEEQGSRTARRYRDSFPASYCEAFDEIGAIGDILYIDQALRGDIAMNLYRSPEAEDHQLKFKLFIANNNAALSDVLPMLENLGLRVLGEVPHRINATLAVQTGAEAPPTFVRLHDFELETENRIPVDLPRVQEAFLDVFSHVWRGTMDSDGFNKLVLHGGLTARQVNCLRGYARYLLQCALPFSLAYTVQSLFRNPNVAVLLPQLFEARLHPTRYSEPLAQELEASLLASLDQVKSLDEDRILRAFMNAILATTRTNFYQTDHSGAAKPYLAFKFDCNRLQELPLPKPEREIFVFAPSVEGVHLRFGAVARGGLRWSDRQEDFRTEVLGLVKAQQVKNSVIVPVGSKGGFVLRRPPSPTQGRDAFQRAGIAGYRTFISGLLDLTDNLVGESVVPPAEVHRRDGDDPYLVVAADKGTATFSDISNELARQYGFWLDDAFASGGSVGYDHKKMGITARGAWESVKRHFRELGKDIQRQGFTCIGVGDMSGDVFGNGMLLSEHTQLIGAFNHLHIFIDPNPDAAVAFTERRRLFALPRSGWDDYDPALLSRGGGVFERSSKSIPISEEMKARFDIEADALTPNQLIQALLKARTELLFFGGIGTYIRAKGETDADAGDRFNDAVRIHAGDVRAAVVGEGANLAVTQRARIEFSLGGGRCNSDFIDNCAGVSCSDHEVNIKILLTSVEREGRLTREQRDQLLEQMTAEVGELVLRDTYQQTQSLSVTESLGTYMADRTARLMRGLERTSGLSRGLEFLPDDELLLERTQQGLGFARPELCVLLSYAKNALFAELASNQRLDQACFDADLFAYFPKPLQEDHPEAIRRHRLRREIIATVLANETLNRVGLSFVLEAQEKSGLDAVAVVQAYVAARRMLALPVLWDAVEKLDNRVQAQTQTRLLTSLGRLHSSTCLWLLRNYKPQFHDGTFDVEAEVRRFKKPIEQLRTHLSESLTGADRVALTARTEKYRAEKVPDDLAATLAELPFLSSACDIVWLSDRGQSSVSTSADVYFAVGRRLGYEWLRGLAGQVPIVRPWDKRALAGVNDDLYRGQRALALAILTASDTKRDANASVDSWLDASADAKELEGLLTELRATPTADFPMIAVATGRLTQFARAQLG